jgi:hypothetical protein
MSSRPFFEQIAAFSLKTSNMKSIISWQEKGKSTYKKLNKKRHFLDGAKKFLQNQTFLEILSIENVKSSFFSNRLQHLT